MFDKILIANRGEIACRVMRTAKRMGIGTVAVYSDADVDALHVLSADEAVHVGASPSAESYLLIDRIIAAAKDTGADAVHPGYGFLAENAAFCEALEAAGITFIGPGIKAIGAMGDKIRSKQLAHEAKVSTVPGHLEPVEDDKEAVKIAKEIGFPVMLKASAGGGGKGMRIARSADEVRDGLRSAQSEARSSFGDDRVFIEKYIDQPRHIEIQVLADAHGNTIHLGERECSIQRRHQKVIEEAPSPFVTPEMRAAMGAEAVALARAVEYRSAGTVEFIVDADRNFYFLEMNTRLQVEHPITELVTGLDLVELMIRVAAGEPLPITQDDVKLEGWAIESRVYAEDPRRGFLPSIGRLTRYSAPEGMDGIRIDTGVYEGAEISMFYDPMIAKLVSYGADREIATARMRDALDAYVIRGVQHNVAFLSVLLGLDRFAEGRLTTNFIAEEFPDGFHEFPAEPMTTSVLVAAGAVIHRLVVERDGQIEGRLREPPPVASEWVAVIENGSGRDEAPLTVSRMDDEFVVQHRAETLRIATDWAPGDEMLVGSVNGIAVCVQVDMLRPADGLGMVLTYRGVVRQIKVLTKRAAELAAKMPIKEPPDLSRFLLSPMPGLLIRLTVEEGQEVKAGEELAVVEAMKMENVLRAERDGVVAKLHAGPGDSLAVDQAILEFG